MTKSKALRCAIYTRKSSEEGLEQDFNSLHAQRDACEAYVLSQAGEGWTALPTAYDDGGISGGTMERPGLKALLSDIAARRVDVVVVYKVDRLTRSLADFAKIVEVFDQNQVSFVSVTQSFNTTSSMGRLTLNMLLSFAQFEREVTSERIRDKIAASKKKGMWMGGNLPLGYDADGRTLRINEAEAETVRHIFRRYIELKSVQVLAEELRDRGIRSKRRQTKAGAWIGGEVFTRGALFHLLTNRVYLGMVPHKKEAYPGLHKPILDQGLFDQTQEVFAANRYERRDSPARRARSLLVGRIFDANGWPMTPSFTTRPNGRVYRYYVSAPEQKGQPRIGRPQRVPAAQLEAWVTAQTAALGQDLDLEVWRIDLLRDRTVLRFVPADIDDPELREHRAQALVRQFGARDEVWREDDKVVVSVPQPAVFRGGARRIFGAVASSQARCDRAMIGALRRAHRLAGSKGPLDPAGPGGPINVYDRKLIELAFLAPDIQSSLVNGRQREDLTLADLLRLELPLLWSDQRNFWRTAANQARSSK